MGTIGTDRASELERLYLDHGSHLWRALLGYTGDPTMADDAVAEAFSEALRQWDRIEDPRAWLWRVAFRTASKELRRTGRHGDARSDEEVAYTIDDRALQVALALAKLPARQRAVVILHYYADLTIAQIGETLGMSSSTAGVHLHRARNRLHTILGDDDD